MVMKILAYLMISLFLMQLANAVDYKQEFYLQDKKTNVIIHINYEQETNFNFYLDLPKDVNNIKVYFDNQEKTFKIRQAELNNFVNIFGKATNVKIEYITEFYIEKATKYYFTSEITPVIDGNLETKVILPEGATLDKPYTDKTSSIYPKPTKLETDGKNLIILWKQETNAYEPFAIFLVYNIPSFNYYILLALFLIALIVFFTFKIIKKREVKIKKVKINNIEKHLKDEEKLIVNILKKKKGSCTQSTLLTLTNMSKASLSRLLQELEKRSIIRKEQIGNKNLIILKK